MARALQVAGTLAGWQGDTRAGIELIERSLDLYQADDDRRGSAWALFDLARTRYFAGQSETALRLNEESLAIARESGDRELESAVLGNIGVVQRALGNIETSTRTFEQALQLSYQVDATFGVLIWLTNLGENQVRSGDVGLARSRVREALLMAERLNDARFTIENLESAGVILTESDPRLAVRLFGAAAAGRDILGYPVIAVSRDQYDADLDHLRDGLGDAAFDAEWERGRTLSLAEATDLALAAVTDSESTS
jgi:tetratricopeptide (TPR) repeat protein